MQAAELTVSMHPLCVLNSSFGLNQKNQKFKAVKKLAKIYFVSLNEKNSPTQWLSRLKHLFVFNASLHKFLNAISSRPAGLIPEGTAPTSCRKKECRDKPGMNALCYSKEGVRF
jgi:hypothetical protein